MAVRIIAILCALLALTGCALAEEYYSAGGFAAQAQNGDLYVAAADGILRVSEDGNIQTVADGGASDLQIAGDALYYTAQVYDENGNRTASIRRFDPETGENTMIAAPLPAGTSFEFDPNYFYQTRHTSRYGYADVAVRGDSIYYIGDDNVPGAAATECIDWNDAPGRTGFRTEYESCAAVYRMDLNGENAEMLIPRLGNGANARMTVTGDQIIIATCWQNAVASEDFVNFVRYAPDGTPIDMIVNTGADRHARYYREDQEFACAVDALLANDDVIYASLAVSGGESSASRLVDPENMRETLAYEAFSTPSALHGNDIVYLTSDVQGTQWENRIPYTLRLMVRGARGDRCVAYIPAEFAGFDMRIAVLGDMVYLRMNDALLRVDAGGGMPQLLMEDGFADCDAFEPVRYATAEVPEEADGQDETDSVSKQRPE